MKILQIERINTLLILISMALAFFLPFELFLFSYAVLGPLHYLTEINWIDSQNYFVPEKRKIWKIAIIVYSFLYSIPFLVKLPVFEPYLGNRLMHFLYADFALYTNGILLLALVGAIILVTIKNRIIRIIILAITVLASYVLKDVIAYNLLLGAFIPTVIHVYLFTLLFMIYGNIKSKKKLWSFNVIIMILIPFFLIMITILPKHYNPSTETINKFLDSGFHNITHEISMRFFNPEKFQFYFKDVIDIKVQIFISFAYTYHYLNWFSKTTIIGWHKRLTQKKSILFVFIWIASLAIYGYDYKVGLALLVFLSILHVFLEFPLNVVTAKEIGKFIIKKKH